MMCLRTVAKDLEVMGLSWTAAKRLAPDRARWKTDVAAQSSMEKDWRN